MDNAAASPRVSAVIPAYNASRWIRQAILSLTTQTFSSLEIVAVDDGSTDGTRDILSDLAAADPRIRYALRPHEGISRTMNFALRMAKGEYVARLDADDIALPDRVARQVAFLDANPSVAVVGGYMIAIDANDRKHGMIRYPVADLKSSVVTSATLGHPATMFRRQFVLDLGGYRPAFDTAEDFDLWLRISEKAELANLARPVTYYRYHDDQVTSTQSRRQQACAIVARGLAKARRESRPDRVDEDFVLTEESVMTLGLDAESASRARSLLAGE